MFLRSKVYFYNFQKKRTQQLLVSYHSIKQYFKQIVALKLGTQRVDYKIIQPQAKN